MSKYIKQIIVVASLLLLTFYGTHLYNSMVEAEEPVEEAWANVETAYQRRFDLIPNLVEVVKGYADFEKETMIAVTEARASAMNGMASAKATGDLGALQKGNSQLSGAMGRFFGYTEKYPDLKANQNFLELQAELEGTENRISVARDAYNEKVREFNSLIKKFPRLMFASMAGFHEKDFFDADPGAEVAPKIDMTN